MDPLLIGGGLLLLLAAVVIVLRQRGEGVTHVPAAPPAAAASGARPVSDDLRARAAALVARGQMIQAVKLVRDETGMGLAEAKHYAEGLIGSQLEPAAAPMPSADLAAQAAALVARDRKLEAIKLVRQHTGLGLKEAKDYVEALEGDPPAGLPELPEPELPEQLGRAELDARALAMAHTNKIAAIKLVRQHTGLGLKEAKDYVEALERAAGR